MKSKLIKEKKLITIQYTIEKSEIQQRKLKNDIVDLSTKLQQSKLNNGIMLGVLIVVLVIGAVLMHFSNTEKMSNSDYKSVQAYGAFQEAQKVDDSLKLAVQRLTKELSSYKLIQASPLKASIVAPSIADVVVPAKEIKNVSIVNNGQSNTTASKQFIKHSCFVNKIFKMNGVVFIEANIIEEDKNKNRSKTVQVLQLHKDVKIHKGNGVSIAFDMKIFQKIMEDKHILNILIKDRVVYRINEEERL